MSRVLPGVSALAIIAASTGSESGITQSTGTVSFANVRAADEAAETERAVMREKKLTGFYTQEHELVLFEKVTFFKVMTYLQIMVLALFTTNEHQITAALVLL